MNAGNSRPNEERDFEERLRRFRGTEPPPSCWEGIESRIESPAVSFWSKMAMAAAALLLATVTAVFVIVERRQPVEPPERPGVRRIPVNEDPAVALSLATLNRMSNDPEKLLDYLDSHNRPMRRSEEVLTPLTRWN